MGTNYIAPIWRMPENTNKDKLSNYSINLPLTSDNISMGIVPNLFIGSWSISFWFKTIAPGAGNQNGCMVGRYVSANLNGDLEIRSDNGHIVVATGQNFPNTNTTEANAIKSITSDINDGNWHHCAFSLDYNNGTSTRKLYIDGSLDSSDSSTSPPKWVSNTTQTLFLGQLFNNNAVYNGSINQVSIFDYAIESDQVTYLYGLNNPMVITGGEPIAYWPLGDNSNPNASAGYPNTSVGSDSVFDFDRSTQDEILIDENNNKLFQGVSAFTVSAWVKLKTNTGYDHGVVGNDGVSTRGFYMTMKNSPQLRFFVSTTGTTSDAFTYTNPTSTLNRWVHYVVIWDGSNMDMYVDGMYSQTQACVNATGTFTAPVGTVIGGPLGQGGDNKYYFDGEISNVQIWYQRLSHGTASVGDVAGGDIATLYNNGQPIMTGTQPEAANLKAWYKLNQSSNWEADSAGDWQIPDATSAFPQSFNFIAANSDAIQFGPSSGLGFDTQISISAWFNQTPGGGNLQQLVAEDKTGSSRNWGIILVGRIPNFQFFDEAGVQVQLVGTALTEGKWHHILCTATGDTSTNGVKMYINGQLVAQGTASNENIKNDNIQAKIGTQSATTPTYYFDGKISNVALWSSDQSSEKDNIYNNGTPATSYTNTPQYWYKLDNTSVWNPAPANYWTFPNAGEQDNSGIFNFSN